MGRNARKEAVVKLREQIDTCTDPKILMGLTRQLNKLLLKPKAVMGRPRNTPQASASIESTYISNGSAMGNMPLGEQTLHRLVIAIEDENKRRRLAGLPKMTDEEQAVWVAKMVDGFSDEERVALAAYVPDARSGRA